VADPAVHPPSRLSRDMLEAMAVSLFTNRVKGATEEIRQTKPEQDVYIKWAYSFAGHPRRFIAELIKDWNEPHWAAWRAFISAVFVDRIRSTEELRIFKECTQLDELPKARPPSVWMPVGRRGGKSRILAAIAVYMAVCYDWSHYLDPGEMGVIPVLAADRRQARTIMGYVKAFLEHPRLKDRVTKDSAESINIDTDKVVEVVTASYRAVRSRTVLAALCDEIAFWQSDDASLNPDHEIIAALEPSMATIPNALLLGASSPYARRGVLWDHFDKWFGKPGGPLIWKAPTIVMNPTVPQSFLDEKYEEDPIAAAAEYGAEFRTDVDAFITREALDSAITTDYTEYPPNPSIKSYKAFCDPSGGSSDSMTLAIGHIDPMTRRGVLDLLRERRPPFSPEAVVEEFARTMREYRVFRVRGDHYGGEWPRERFKVNGIQYDLSKRRKSDIYFEFLPLINAGRVELLNERRMYNQFLGLERRTSRGGHESIDHGPGAHDDLANVAAGVMVELLGKHNPAEIHPTLLAASMRTYTRHSLDNIRPSAIPDWHGGPKWG